MRILQILVLALVVVAARADIFTFTINPSTQTATMADEEISCFDKGNCSGGASFFACGGIAGTVPTFCDLRYNREESFFLDPEKCAFPDVVSCPNDGVPLFDAVAIVDGSGNIEALFGFGVHSHSLVGVFLSYGPDIPRTLEGIGPIDAFVVDNGHVQSFNVMTWTDGEVDTFRAEIVPEPSTVLLLATAGAIGLLVSKRRRTA